MIKIKRLVILLILFSFTLIGCESNKGKWVNENNQWYYISKQDDSKTIGWIKDNNKHYYCNQDGIMLNFWQLIDNNWYYFYSNGEMAHDCYIDNYYLGSNGVWTLDIPKPSAPPEAKLYKHVPVKITKIQQTYYFKGAFKMYIEYKSDEYGLTHSVTIGNNEPYANECYMGQYKVGDTIYAVMYSWQQGEVVTRRELDTLDYNR